MGTCDIGIFGLGIMGQNLAINCAGHDYTVAVFNRKEGGEAGVVASFIEKRCGGKSIAGASTIREFVDILKVPRKIILLVEAGNAVDEVLDQLTPFLKANDVVIDGGNSHYRDTERRLTQLESRGIHFVGCGLSGGADGALKGPSIMPGGSFRAWETIRPIFQKIAAKSEDRKPCCNWIGPGGSGHFVKMVHNGIEYALMQLVAEAYDIMNRMLSLSTDEIQKVIGAWNKGDLSSYLLEITCHILRTPDKDGSPLIKKIRDCAEQKGTGKNIFLAALDLRVPATTIQEAVSARFLSSMVDERRYIAEVFTQSGPFAGEKRGFINSLHDALYCSQIVVYTQGFLLLQRVSVEYNWDLDLAIIAQTWRNGCIIRSKMLNKIEGILHGMPLRDILLASPFVKTLNTKQLNWRHAVATAMTQGIPVPALSSALACFDGLRSNLLPANLIQAQRDYFGSHGYERTDFPPGAIFHMKDER